MCKHLGRIVGVVFGHGARAHERIEQDALDGPHVRLTEPTRKINHTGTPDGAKIRTSACRCTLTHKSRGVGQSCASATSAVAALPRRFWVPLRARCRVGGVHDADRRFWFVFPCPCAISPSLRRPAFRRVFRACWIRAAGRPFRWSPVRVLVVWISPMDRARRARVS